MGYNHKIIDSVLRSLDAHRIRLQRWSSVVNPLVADNKRLRAELAAAIKQRDEARRDACLWALPKGVVWNDAMLARAKAIAAERGWDCFKDGGGAC
jgi:hypothetical protein